MQNAMLRRWLFASVVAVLGGALTRCALPDEPVAEDDPSDLYRMALNAAQRRERCTVIRDVAARNGITNGMLLGGIADSETGLCHCWSEATWACQGPDSADCGGPVIAGSGDGACSLRQGGLGMFQFDGGTYDDTLAREGERILSVAGNVEAAVDFVTAMVTRSTFIDGVDTAEQAHAWMNEVRPGNAYWDAWITTVTAYYNGCWPDRCGVFASRYERYASHTADILAELGEDFWYGEVVVPECEPVPAGGRVIDDTDPCFDRRGTPSYWHHEGTGWDGSCIWTIAGADSRDNHAYWRLDLAEAGDYVVEVHTPAPFNQSRQAPYSVTHAGETDVVRIDQSATDGWHELGRFRFAAGPDQHVLLEDLTGEPVADRVQIVFDALRLTRWEEPPPDDAGPDGGEDAGPDGGDDAGADADADADQEEDLPPEDAGLDTDPPDDDGGSGGGAGLSPVSSLRGGCQAAACPALPWPGIIKLATSF